VSFFFSAFCLFVCFPGKGLVLARQALYYSGHTPALCALVIFQIGSHAFSLSQSQTLVLLSLPPA
jgi:hypothetical protein